MAGGIGHPATTDDAFIGWMRGLVDAWRSAWRASATQVRDRMARSFLSFDGAVRATAYVLLDPRSDAGVFAVRVWADVDGGDVLSVVRLQDEGHAVEERLRSLPYWIAQARRNWFPGRPWGPPLVPWNVAVSSSNDGSLLLQVPGLVHDIDPMALVAYLADPLEEAVAVPAGEQEGRAPSHLYQLGQDRENVAIERALYTECQQILGLLGLGSLWWCGLWLERRDVFDEALDGDIDIIAGPLRLDFTPDEFQELVRAECQRHPLATPPETHRERVTVQAAWEGHIVWPPDVSELAACEVKASWYGQKRREPPCEPAVSQAPEERWHATHVNRGARLKGQLRLSLDQGIERVAFLHLCATRPEKAALNPWVDAGARARRAFESGKFIFDPAELPACGYYALVQGAVERAEEHHEGATVGVRVFQPATHNPRSDPQAAWRAKLQARLAKLPKPPTPNPFIIPCSRCGGWNTSRTPMRSTVACPCGG